MKYKPLLLALLIALPAACIAAWQPDGNPITLNGVSVTASFPSDGCIYVEKSDRSLGIRVNTASVFADGSVVNVTGTLKTDSVSGERYIAPAAPSPTATGSSAIIKALELPNRALAGKSGDIQPGIVFGAGVASLGLAVITSGKVTQTDPQGRYFYVDDGCGLQDGTLTGAVPNTGVRIAADGRAYASGKHMTVVGISSCFKAADGLHPLIKLRRVEDALPSPTQLPDLSSNSDLHGNRPFPYDNEWNRPIDKDPVDPNSDAIIASIGSAVKLHPDFGANWNGGPFGIPYIVVSGATPKVPVSFDYADESDPGPYPIPSNAPIEGGPSSTGDRHVLVIDRDNWKLYELYYAYPDGHGGWTAGSGAVFDLKSNKLRPAGWTSADAAGLPIFPGLVRYDEVVIQKEIRHAIRFTVARSRKGYVYPALHFASSLTDTSLPPMGMRVRLKASFNTTGYPANVQVILKAMKTYGMIVADNGSNWYFSGAPDSRWNDNELSTLKQIAGSNFEVVKMGQVITK